MKKPLFLLLISILLLAAAFGGNAIASQTPDLSDRARLELDSEEPVEITTNPETEVASFVQMDVPVQQVQAAGAGKSYEDLAMGIISKYPSTFGITNARTDFAVVDTVTDSLGMTHVSMKQVYQGVEVFGGEINVHFNQDGSSVVAVSSSFHPISRQINLTPALSEEAALETALQALPGAELVSPVRMVVYPHRSGSEILAWLVELRDDMLPARNLYVVNAHSGYIDDAVELLASGRDRETYTARHTNQLPGQLVRVEESPASGDKDLDQAHDFAGATYDYYWTTHQRDSFDGEGQTIVSTVHYGRNYLNAFWNGEQMVYGDGFPVKDVVAHELTHAVIEYTAGLVYNWQSGALNESFADIFGAMVDRDDWLMGEDLPPQVLGGLPAIRSLSNPNSLDQPDHVSEWYATCSDNEGVHTNSGITNKAFYNIASAISKEKAEKIFFRALTTYLTPRASLEDARAAALRAAADLFGNPSAEYTGVQNGFNAVGLDGRWNPPTNSCSCSVQAALTDAGEGPSALESLDSLVTLYRVRQELLDTSAKGQYFRQLYERHTGNISALLAKNPELKARGARLLVDLTPGLKSALNPEFTQEVVMAEDVLEVQDYLKDLAAEDRVSGNGELAASIDEEMARIEWDHLVGMTYDEAWSYLSEFARSTLFIPLLQN